MPGEPIGPLHSIRPKALSEINRVLYYIYSRSMINKAKNFTHMTEKDYQMMASLISGEIRNVGQLIFDEMKKFRFYSTRQTPIPYPQLVSYILRIHNIWYLDPSEQIIRIPKFGRVHLGRMQIEVGRAKSKRVRPDAPSVPTTPRTPVDEAQSSARAGSPGPPSFIGATLQKFFHDALATVSENLKQSNEQLMSEMNNKMKHLVESVDRSFEVLLDNQEQLKQKVYNLELLVSNLSKTHAPSTSTGPQPSMPSPSDILFTIPDPHTSAPIDITFTTTSTTPISIPPATAPSSPSLRLSSSTSHDSHESEPQPHTPATDIPSISVDPISHILLTSPPSPSPSVPPPSSDITLPSPVILPSDADKKGEKSQESV